MNDKTEELVVEFYKVDLGWLFFRIRIGEQEFDGRFSEVFDPLINFKHWLESISIGAQQTSFHYDPEGEDIKFDFEQICWDRTVFTISELYANKNQPPLLKSDVDRRQLVKAFYLGLLNFYGSDKFISSEWEVEYIKESLEKKLGMDEEKLTGYLLDLNRKELIEIFFIADPVYYISYPEAKDKNEDWNLFIKDIVDKENEVENDLKRVETPREWNIPEDYDYWNSFDKKKYIIKNINYPKSGNQGTKIEKFRSNLIEKYLEGEY